MKQTDKELLMKDLCGKLPYKTYVKTAKGVGYVYAINNSQLVELSVANDSEYWSEVFNIDEIKPYLRLMSSMTNKELIEFLGIRGMNLNSEELRTFREGKISIVSTLPSYSKRIDWLNKNHFDFHGLIPKGLAIAVTKENNPYKE